MRTMAFSKAERDLTGGRDRKVGRERAAGRGKRTAILDRMNRIHRMDRRGSRGTENWKTGNYEWRE